MLRGDEVGALLADFLLRQGVRGVYATSIVSSSLLGKMAAAHGQPYEETLTGFKWIGRIPGLAFGYEEALGYCVDPTRVKDKDGISALLRVVELAALLKASGQTLQRPARRDRRTSTACTPPTSSRCGSRTCRSSRRRWRTSARPRPTEIGGLAVLTVEDLRPGRRRAAADRRAALPARRRARVVVRPSGTEPKLKCYLEVIVPGERPRLGAATAAEARSKP